MSGERPAARRLPVRLSLLAAAPVALAIIGYHLHTQAADLDVKACVEQTAAHPLLPDYWLLGGSVAAILVGRVFGPRIHRTPKRRGAQQLSSIVGILATMLFFAAVGAALIYEAVGVRVSKARSQQPVEVQQLEPITHYARCAIYYDLQSHWANWHTGLWSVFAIGFICILVGYWLWSLRSAPPQPPTGHDERSTGATTGWPWPVALIVTIAIGAAIVWGLLHFLNSWIEGTAIVTQAVIGGPDTGASFRDGIRAVIAFVFVGFVCIATLDFVFARQRWTPIAARMQDWSRANPWFVFVLLLIIGALLTHFIANLIHYPVTGQGGSGLDLSTFLASDVLVIVLFGLVVLAASIAPSAAGARRAAHDSQSSGADHKLGTARRALVWHITFIGLYTTALAIASVLIARWLSSNATPSTADEVSSMGPIIAGLTIVGGLCAVVGDGALFRTLHVSRAARLAAGAAIAKFLALSVVVVYVLAGSALVIGQLGGGLFGS